VNVAAIERNVARLRERLSPGTSLYAVVKADGYGHGAVQAAQAAVRGGAEGLAVATAQEAVELRAGGIRAPVLVMGALSPEELPDALAAGAELVAWSEEFVEEVARIATGSVRLHVKFDTGMGRLGTRDLGQALAVADAIAAHDPRLGIAGAMTHFATADDDAEFLDAQLRAFQPFVDRVREWVPDLIVHAANSAAVLQEPRSQFGMVRPGIAIYGCDPMNEDPARHGLEPALALTSYIAALKLVQAGQSAGYGRRFVADRETWTGTLPIGYADGIRRALSNNCDVLVGGRRYPLVGTVSMDNIAIDLGQSPAVGVGAVATILGTDGEERQTAEDVARRIDTINYEILCGISARVPRAYHRDGAPV
jgi:alanine racemase